MKESIELGPNPEPETTEGLKTNKPEKKPTKKFNKRPLILALGLAMFGAGAYVAAPKIMSMLDSGKKAPQVYVTQKQYQELKNSVHNIEQVISQLRNELDGMSTAIATAKLTKQDKDEIVQQAIAVITPKITKAVNDASAEQLSVVKREVDGQVKQLVKLSLDPYTAFNNHQMAHNQQTDDHFASIDALLNELKTVNISKPVAAAPARERLKEFNVAVEVEKGVYSVQSPNHGDEKHWITLWEGERFVSKVGRHVVTGVEVQPDGSAVLLIDKKYFIDDERDEYTPNELASFQKRRDSNSSVRTAKVATKRVPASTIQAIQTTSTSAQNIGVTTSTNANVHDVIPQINGAPNMSGQRGMNDRPSPQGQSQPQMVVPTTTRVNNANVDTNVVRVTPLGNGDAVHYRDGKILLPNWATITQESDLSSALVVNLANTDNRPIKVELHKNYDFLGLVNEITADGTICSDVYCIGGLK